MITLRDPPSVDYKRLMADTGFGVIESEEGGCWYCRRAFDAECPGWLIPLNRQAVRVCAACAWHDLAIVECRLEARRFTEVDTAWPCECGRPAVRALFYSKIGKRRTWFQGCMRCHAEMMAHGYAKNELRRCYRILKELNREIRERNDHAPQPGRRARDNAQSIGSLA